MPTASEVIAVAFSVVTDTLIGLAVLGVGGPLCHATCRVIGIRTPPIVIGDPLRESRLAAVSWLGVLGIVAVWRFLLDRPLGIDPSDFRFGAADLGWLALEVMMTVAPVLAAARATSQTLDSVGVRAEGLGKGAVLGLAMSGAYVAGALLVGPLLLGFELGGVSMTFVWGFVGFALVAAGEELVFRGYIQTRLVGRYGPALGLLGASVLFALTHLPRGLVSADGWASLGPVLGNLSYGLLFGYVMHRSQNLVAPFLLHLFVNWQSLMWG